MATYESPFSVDKRNETFINYRDPRARNGNLDKTRARIGRDVTEIGRPEVTGRKNISPSKRKIQYWFAAHEVEYPNSPLDNNNNPIYITDQYIYTSDFEYYTEYGDEWPALSQLDQNGNILWKKFISYNGFYDYTPLSSIVCDTDHNAYITLLNYTNYSGSFVKVDKDGNKIWEKYFPSTYNLNGGAIGPNVNITTTIDNNNNIYMAYQNIIDGLNPGFDNLSQAVISKFDSDGNELGSYLISAGADGIRAESCKVDSAGNLYVLCKSFVSSNLSIYKFNTNFEFIDSFSITTNFPTNYFTWSNFTIDSNGNYHILFRGYFNTQPNGHVIILKINSNKEIEWQKGFYATGFDGYPIFINPLQNFIDIDQSGNLYFIHSYKNLSTDPYDNYTRIFKLNSEDGSIVWIRNVTNLTVSEPSLYSIAVYKNRALYVTGSTAESGGFSPGLFFIGKVPLNGSKTKDMTFFNNAFDLNYIIIEDSDTYIPDMTIGSEVYYVDPFTPIYNDENFVELVAITDPQYEKVNL